MKSQGLIKKAIFYIFLLYGLYPISCPGQTRQIETKRLMHYTNNMDFSSHTSVSSSTTNQTYQYCPDNPELISSIFNQHTSSSWNEYTGNVTSSDSSTVFYFGTLTWENGFKHISYQTSQNNNMDIWKDVQNRILEYDSTDPSYRIRNYYNTSGKLDSTYYSYNGIVYAYKLHYANNGTVSYVNDYQNNDEIQISCSGIIPYTYPLNIDDVFLYGFNPALLLFRVTFDPTYNIESYSEDNHTIHPQYTDNTVSFTSDTGTEYTYSFNSGYLTEDSSTFSSTSSISYHQSFGENFTWETITANDDESAPTPAISINAYPNPFHNTVKLEFSEKTNSPADIAIYNIRGQLVRRWDNVRETSLTWDGKDKNNNQVSSGIYLIKARQGAKNSVGKVVKIW